jgi:hypothetical protein
LVSVTFFKRGDEKTVKRDVLASFHIPVMVEVYLPEDEKKFH